MKSAAASKNKDRNNNKLSAYHASILDRIYNDPGSAGSFGGVEGLYQAVRPKLLGITRQQVRQFLDSTPEYGKHRMQRHHFPQRKIISYGLDWLWEIDLADLSSMARQNDNHHFLLHKIDVLSKRGDVEPMRHKSAEETLAAFKKIVARAGGVCPKNLYTDRGTEFFNEQFAAYTKANGINHYPSFDNRTGAATAERYIRTMKSKIFRYLSSPTTTAAGGRRKNRYIDALPLLVSAYNRSKHRVIKMRPVDVRPEHVDLLMKRCYPDDDDDDDCTSSSGRRKAGAKYQVGDRVRRQLNYKLFQKGYTGNQFSHEVYKIARVIDNSDPVTYKLCADTKECLPVYDGIYYQPQLVPVLRSLLNPITLRGAAGNDDEPDEPEF
jgi:Integrase core domain